jgi:hypothetical protein
LRTLLRMPNQCTAADVRLFHCMMSSADPAEKWDDPVSALRREMKLLRVERDLLRTKLAASRATEDDLREQVERLSVMEAEARKAVRFWRREAERMPQESPHHSQWGWRFLFRLKGR